MAPGNLVTGLFDVSILICQKLLELSYDSNTNTKMSNQSADKPRVGIIALLVKAGPKVGATLLKLVKGLKFGKVGLAAASFAGWATVSTWQFAVILMLSLGIHESGHVWAMRRCGIPTKGFYFIPFLGGAAISEESARSRSDEAFVVFMGPIFGLGVALAFALGHVVTGSPLLAAAASWTALVNLFNLLPVNPLDGGRLMTAVMFSLHSRAGLVWMGLSVVAASFLAVKLGLMLFSILAIVGLMETFGAYRQRRDMPSLGAGGIVGTVVGYLALAGVLFAVMLWMSHEPGAATALDTLYGKE